MDQELPLALATLPDRLPAELRTSMLAWLLGRAEQPTVAELRPWQSKWEYYDLASSVRLGTPGRGGTPG